MNLKALIQKRADLVKEQAALFADGRALTAEDKTRDDAIAAEVAELDGDIARAKRAKEMALNAPGVPVGEGRVTEMHDRAGDAPFASLGDFLQTVADAGRPGRNIDPRLLAASGASSGVPSDGGFLVRHDFSTQLLDGAIEQAVLAPLCLPIEVGENADGVDLPYINETSRADGSRWGGVQVYWRAEADTVTATKPNFDLHDLRLQELMGLAYATDRLLRDASALESIFRIAFTSEMAFKLDDAIFRGSGAGMPLGVIDSSGPRVEQAKETGQAADTVVSENISKMWTRVRPRSKGRGVWLYNSEVGAQFDGLYYPAGTAGIPTRVVSYDESGVARIKGRPALEIEQASALGDAGDLVFADLTRYALVRKGGLQADQSMHVRFLYGENTFRWTMRVNGRPVDKSAITPYKGAATQSAFVTLAAR